jgi:hypothetical protein
LSRGPGGNQEVIDEGSIRVSEVSRSDLRCPICGVGVLRDVAVDERFGSARQTADSEEIIAFTCGHEVRGRGLDEASRDDPNVERRRSEETVEPVDGDVA